MLFICANNASTKLRKVVEKLELKNTTSLLYLPISSLVETWKIFRNILCLFFFAWALILGDKNSYFGRHLFCKTKTDYACKLHVQDFATGKNFSFDQCSKKESFAFFSTVMQTLDFISGLHNCLEFSQPLECLHQAMQTQKTFSIPGDLTVNPLQNIGKCHVNII